MADPVVFDHLPPGILLITNDVMEGAIGQASYERPEDAMLNEGVTQLRTDEAFVDHLNHAIRLVGIDYTVIGTDWAVTTAAVPESLKPGIVSFIRRATDITEETKKHEPFPMDKFDTGLGRFQT